MTERLQEVGRLWWAVSVCKVLWSGTHKHLNFPPRDVNLVIPVCYKWCQRCQCVTLFVSLLHKFLLFVSHSLLEINHSEGNERQPGTSQVLGATPVTQRTQSIPDAPETSFLSCNAPWLLWMRWAPRINAVTLFHFLPLSLSCPPSHPFPSPCLGRTPPFPSLGYSPPHSQCLHLFLLIT